MPGEAQGGTRGGTPGGTPHRRRPRLTFSVQPFGFSHSSVLNICMPDPETRRGGPAAADGLDYRPFGGRTVAPWSSWATRHLDGQLSPPDVREYGRVHRAIVGTGTVRRGQG